jgi:predicted  nucleic acid-binding Zn-ribbon protein
MTAWESQAVTRLKREREGLIKERDKKQTEVNDFNFQIRRYDARIDETLKRENNETTGSE